jgi:predicted 2-oxoglutarate/Fe(II)-dependent dioxygenase YbiX
VNATVLDERRAIITIDEVMTPAECAAEIAFAEAIGFAQAPITTANGPVMAEHVRNNTRVMVDDHARAAALWERVRAFAPARERYDAVALNERLRFYRYEPGQRFTWHRDGSYRRGDGARSQLTLMVYLNEDFEGGATQIDIGEVIDVRPRAGTTLMFEHAVRHQGAPVERGRKYVLRTDVIYRRQRFP